MSTSQVLVLLLAAIAFAVFILLVAGVTPWLLIVFYWLVLTLKNLVDFQFTRGKGANSSGKESA